MLKLKKFSIPSLLLMAVLLVPALPSPAFTQIRSSESTHGSFRVIDINTVKMTHPKTGEKGLAIAVRGVLYDLGGEELLMGLWSEGSGKIGYAFPLNPTYDEERFMAAMFIPVSQAYLIDAQNVQIHLCYAGSKKLIQSFVISDSRY